MKKDDPNQYRRPDGSLPPYVPGETFGPGKAFLVSAGLLFGIPIWLITLVAVIVLPLILLFR